MRIQIGAGLRPLKGFENFDIYPREDVQYGEAKHLPCSDGSVDFIFSNAVFEHLEPAEYTEVFTEWKRVLSDNGFILALGIPDLSIVAHHYLLGDLSLDQLYRYAVGEISDTSSSSEYISQVHKKAFNINILKRIFIAEGTNAISFRYCYPGEELKINLGVVARFNGSVTLKDIEKFDFLKPFIQLDTLVTN